MKYPKTMHLPWSPGVTDDDKVIQDLSFLERSNIVMTEKLDGENTFMDSETTHARSENSGYHQSRDLVKALHAKIRHLIPKNLAIFGENMYAKHSIEYENLSDVFYVFAIFDKASSQFLSWAETKAVAKELGLTTVPVMYEGPYGKFFDLPKHSKFGNQIEGYVIRDSGRIPIGYFSVLVAKFVRMGHVQTDEHWKRNWVPNPPFRKK